MPARAILLRLMLCVALVFNGATSAMASVQMAQMHGQTGEMHASASTAVAEDESGVPPCHHDGQPTHVGSADIAKPAKGEHPALDCCKSNTCTCACVSHVAAVVPMAAFLTTAIAHAGSVRPMALGHAPPPLPHLIRPPIG